MTPSGIRMVAAGLACGGLVAAACGGGGGTGARAGSGPESLGGPSTPERVEFVDVTADVGIDFTHGAFRWEASGDPVAMMGGGVCWLDADGDGWLDLYAVNSYAEIEAGRLEADGGLPTNSLFRNDGGRFTDVSVGSGADLAGRGNGCVAADFDLDGATDLYVTSARTNALLWGDGDGTFTEGAEAAGVDAYGWQSGATVGDVDGDGWPDLFVAGYVDVNALRPESDLGFPNTHRGVRDLLYLSNGPDPSGRVTFREVGEDLGLDPGAEYGLGALFTDVDGDGDLDLYVTNDTNPNRLYVNAPTTDDQGFALVEAGVAAAVADEGSGMGVAGGDYDADGLTDLFVTNFGDQTHALFRNQSGAGTLAFQDGLPGVGMEELGVGLTGWGTSWVDFDLDTDVDLLVANGHVPVTDLFADAEPLQAFANSAAGSTPRLVDVSDAVGLTDVGDLPARGLAVADYDNDGDIDIAVNSIGSPLILLENRGAAGNWLEVALDGFAPGAVVTAVLADGTELTREIYAGSSYLSSEDPRAHFGLRDATKVTELRIDWPDGHRSVMSDVAANQVLVVEL